MADGEPTHAPGLAAIFARAGLRYALIGGHGVNTWIMPRETDDYDFIVAPDRAAIEAVEAELLALGLRHVRRQDQGEPSGPDFSQLKNFAMNLAVDMQVAKTDYQMVVLDRAARSETSGFSVATPEDLIVLKLLAMRSQDQRDIALLIDLLGERLDWPYIEHWAAIWDVSDKLRIFRP
ncbi:MAG: hypothetical protein ACKVT1_06645 [Dehalococcoidia bacterium]